MLRYSFKSTLYPLCNLIAYVRGTAAAARMATCMTGVDKWCLAQAKDLEIREEVSQDISVSAPRGRTSIAYTPVLISLLSHLSSANRALPAFCHTSKVYAFHSLIKCSK